MGDIKLSNECQRDEIQEIIKDQNNLLEDFKGLGRRCKGLEDKMKGKSVHISKKAKLINEEKKEAGE